jgi:hypothetical protein
VIPDAFRGAVEEIARRDRQNTVMVSSVSENENAGKAFRYQPEAGKQCVPRRYP